MQFSVTHEQELFKLSTVERVLFVVVLLIWCRRNTDDELLEPLLIFESALLVLLFAEYDKKMQSL